jgi:hypothetical protein
LLGTQVENGNKGAGLEEAIDWESCLDEDESLPREAAVQSSAVRRGAALRQEHGQRQEAVASGEPLVDERLAAAEDTKTASPSPSHDVTLLTSLVLAAARCCLWPSAHMLGLQMKALISSSTHLCSITCLWCPSVCLPACPPTRQPHSEAAPSGHETRVRWGTHILTGAGRAGRSAGGAAKGD